MSREIDSIGIFDPFTTKHLIDPSSRLASLSNIT
jgi:hypothetical protein